jgi:hypothetical protein
MRSVHVEDARGNEVTLLDPLRMHLLQRGSVIESDDLDEIVAELEPGCPRRRRVLCVLGVGLALLALGGLGVSVALEGAPARQDLIDTLTNPAIMAPSFFVLVWLPWMIGAKRRARRMQVLAVLLKHRRCPHCGYSLRGLPVEAIDDATVCPECACAWRLDDPAIARYGNGGASWSSVCSTSACGAGRTIAVLIGLLALAAGGLLLVYTMR